MNYYKRHLGDYAKDTRTLTTYEHGVYTLLLDTYYSEERPLTADEAMELCRVVTPKERAAVDKVLSRYFKSDGAVWRHSYADRVIAEAQVKSTKAAESAEKRWGKQDADMVIMIHVAQKDRDLLVRPGQIGVPANRCGPSCWIDPEEIGARCIQTARRPPKTTPPLISMEPRSVRGNTATTKAPGGA